MPDENAAAPQAPAPWAPQRRHWLIASVAIPVLCAVIAAAVALVTRRDDHQAAAPVESSHAPPPDQGRPCGSLDDGSIRFGWGPDRPTVAGQQFTDTASMNSDRANPSYGDERQFVTVKDAANTNAGGWKNEIFVEDGKSYLVEFFVHNSADSEPDHTAHDVRVSANVPTCTAHKIRVDGYIDAKDTFPSSVFSNVILQSDRPFTLTYKPGSARYFNNTHPKGVPLPDSIVTSEGALVGCPEMDGVVPGNYACSGIATFEVSAAFPQ